MFGPSIWVIFSIHGKNFFGSISPPRSDTDFTRHVVDRRARMVVMVVIVMVVIVIAHARWS